MSLPIKVNARALGQYESNRVFSRPVALLVATMETNKPAKCDDRLSLLSHLPLEHTGMVSASPPIG